MLGLGCGKSKAPEAGRGNDLRREFEKKRRHLPIRKLMQKAGNAVQAIKPIFMMSPLSIAAYIPSGSLTFDLVIFDEASQVRPTDAFGAILRGKQAIVGNDRVKVTHCDHGIMTRPPTTLFSFKCLSRRYLEALKEKPAGSLLRYQTGPKWVTFALAKSP